MIKEEDLGYNPTITIFPNLLQTQNAEPVLLYKALKRIQRGESRLLINKIRRETVILDSLRNNNLKPNEQSAEYKTQGKKISNLKKKLPCICFNGEFSARSKKDLIKHSGLMVLDFDKMKPKEVAISNLTLQQNKHIVSTFISPSGNGIKALLRVPNTLNTETHSQHYASFIEEFKLNNIDSSGSDVARTCFESFDEDVYINSKAEVYKASVNLIKEIFIQPEVIVPADQETIIEGVLNFNFNTSFVEGQRNEHILAVASLMCEYGVEQQNAESAIMSRIVQGNCKDEPAKLKTIIGAYKIRSFGSKVYEDFRKKNRIERKILNGQTKEQIAKTENVAAAVVENVKKDIENKNIFWYQEKGKTKITLHEFGDFLQANGFWKHYPADSGKPVFVEVKENIVRETSSAKISDFVTNFMQEEKDLLEAYMSYPYLSSDKFLSLILQTLDLVTLRDTAEKSFIPYLNGILEVTKEKSELVSYDKIEHYIWESHILKRNYVQHKIEDTHNDYSTFVENISNQEMGGLISVIGYLISTYKSKTNNKAIILNDEVISDSPEGGTGKGLLMQGISYMRNTCILDGKAFDEKKSFAYQTVNQDTQVLIFDDVKKNFNLESKFSIITEGITLERKNVTAVKLSIEESPKIVISTNYVIQGDGNSHHRRVHEVEISQYYGKDKTPYKEFGRNLFEDWNDEDFEKFDSYMVFCLQYFMIHGLREVSPKNLGLRKLIGATNKDFIDWMDETEFIQLNNKNSKAFVFGKFVAENRDFDNNRFKRKTFNNWLRKYAEYNGLEYLDGSSGGDRWFNLVGTRTKNGISEEDMEIPF
tara:strand:- start:442 stop:2898 length:2457 start_codon:yes stop_codon:yes gene_type:complete